MTTQVRTFPKKTVYHSALRMESERDGLAVKFTTDVLNSTYKDRPPYIRFEVYGDDGGDYAYNIENPEIAEYLRQVPKNEWFVIKAGGSRESAVVEVEAASGDAVFDEAPPPDPITGEEEPPLPFEKGSAHAQAAKANQERAQGSTASQTGSGMGNAYLAALLASAAAIEGFRQEMGRDPTDDERASATAIFIQMNR